MKEKMLAGLERDKMAAKVRAVQHSMLYRSGKAVADRVPG
jgi:hypothetical protein